MNPMAPMPMELPSSFNSFFKDGDLRIGVARADYAQAGGLLAEHHADVLGAAEADADDGRLAGETALAECRSRCRDKSA